MGCKCEAERPQESVPEATWTKPTDACPRPEWWTSTDPQSTELEVSELVGAFVRALQPEFVIETGACIGQTTQTIGLALAENGHGRIVTLEIDEQRAAFARARCAGLPVTVQCGSSLDFVPPEPVGFLWLDSETGLRIPEFERFRPHIIPGSIVGFHDTAPHHGPWGRDVEALPGTRCIRLKTPRGVSFVEVLDA